MLSVSAGTPAWGIQLVKDIERELLRRSLLPVKMPVYTVATAPSAATFKDCWISVSDESGGYVAAFSDGTDWRRCTDRAIIS